MDLLPMQGEWGGESQSDISVRVLERNKECIRIIQRFIADVNKSNDQKKAKATLSSSFSLPSVDTTESIDQAFKVAVLYGVYHVDDLKTKIVNDLGLQAVTIPSSASSLCAWTIPLPSSVTTTTTSSIDSTELKAQQTTLETASSDVLQLKPETIVIMALLSVGYLILGTLDWVVLVKVALEVFTQAVHWGPSQQEPMAAVLSAVSSADFSGLTSVDADTSVSSSSPIAFLVFFIGYFVLYVQRHLQLLRSISAFGIQWDRGLFDD